MEPLKTHTENPPKGRGRPRKNAEEKLVAKSALFTPVQWEKIRQMGWHRLRQLIDRYELD